MQFSTTILVSVILANLVCFGAMLLAQSTDRNLPPRGSIIPGTNQKFLYIQDFWTMTWADLMGVPLIVTAFVHLARDKPSNIWWALGIGIVLAAVFAWICMGANHRPDYGFPAPGKMSLAGILHLIYFGAGVGAAVMCAWNLFSGDLRGPVMWIALAGGVIYAGFWIVEVKSGNFDPLKRIPI